MCESLCRRIKSQAINGRRRKTKARTGKTELEKNVAMGQAIAEKAKFEAEERRKIQEATDEWRRLRAEAELLEEDDQEPYQIDYGTSTMNPRKTSNGLHSPSQFLRPTKQKIKCLHISLKQIAIMYHQCIKFSRLIQMTTVHQLL